MLASAAWTARACGIVDVYPSVIRPQTHRAGYPGHPAGGDSAISLHICPRAARLLDPASGQCGRVRRHYDRAPRRFRGPVESLSGPHSGRCGGASISIDAGISREHRGWDGRPVTNGGRLCHANCLALCRLRRRGDRVARRNSPVHRHRRRMWDCFSGSRL